MKFKSFLLKISALVSLFSLLVVNQSSNYFYQNPQLINKTTVELNNSIASEKDKETPASVLVSHEKPTILEKVTPKSTWNMVTKSLSDNSIEYFYFNEHDYGYREFAYDNTANSLMVTSNQVRSNVKVHSTVNSDGTVSYYTDGYDPIISTIDSSISTFVASGIIGTDDRTLVSNTQRFPYNHAGRIKIIYHDVYNKKAGRYEDRVFIGTGFLQGPDLLVTAGHCVYGDVTSTSGNDDSFEDNKSNPRFADEIIYYPALNGTSQPYGSVNVERIYLENHYYLNLEKDWACCKLSEPIGNVTGWNGKISYFYEKNYPMMTYGYPGDKNGYMYQAFGKMTDFESNGWYYRTDIDSVGGQSGSPYQVTVNNTSYTCGILTYSVGNSYTGGCRIDGLMFAFMNSFVAGDVLPEYVTLFVNSKTGSTWNIRIYNPNSTSITVYYNSKMCFFDDAKNWTGLNDVKEITIDANSDAYVNITENWFATSIAASIMHGSKRLVTYADGLNSSNKSLNLYYNFIA